MRSLSARKNGTALVIGAIPPNLKLLPSNRKHLILLVFFAKRFHRRDFLSLYFKMTYFPLLSHFSASYNQSNNTFKLIKAPEFVVPLSYGTQFVVLSVSPSRTLS